MLKILEKLINYETVDGNVSAFEEAFSFISNIMKGYNIETYSFNNHKCMVISNTLSKDLDIIFGTHIDVVPCNEYKYKLKNGKVFGRGSIDMKGNLSVLLYLLKNNKFNKNIALIITSDEEIDGYSMSQLVNIYNTKLAIIPDGGNNFDLISEEKGLIQLSVGVKTNSAHASEVYKGENAIRKAMDIYNNLIEKYPLPMNEHDYKTSINLSTINGGDCNNKVPEYCSMVLDIRYVYDDKVEDIISFIKSFNCSVEIITIGSLFHTDVNNEMIKKYINVCEEVLEKKVSIKKIASTSDAIYFSDKNIPTIIMNPWGDNPHCDDEYVSVKGLEKLYVIYKKFMEEEDEN